MRAKKVGVFIIALVVVIYLFTGLKTVAETSAKEIGYQFTVDGQPWFVVSNREKLESLLEEYKNQYIINIDENATIKSKEFQQNTEIIEVEVLPEEIIEVDDRVKEKIYAKEKEATIYKVQKGDNLWNIANEYDINWFDLQNFNPDINPDKIWPGDEIIIDPFNPVLDVVIKMENTIEEVTPYENEYQKDSSLLKNQQKVIKEGKDGLVEVTYDLEVVNGFLEKTEIINEKVLKEPIKGVVKIGTKTTVSRGSGGVNYGVVQGKRISSPYGSRIHPVTGRRTFHSGVDIAAPSGNSVYAYSEGRIIEAGWNGGYGYNILIDHGNGLRTRYAHLSKIYVKAGQRVNTGAKIGAVGSTGISTGPHLHFEVIRNGSTTNPLNYI